jgi:chromosome segregation ATPase
MSKKKGSDRPGGEFRRLENMILDLKVLKSELLGAETDEKRLEEMKGFDDFQKKKMALNLYLADLRKDIERLVEMKKNLGEDKDRDTNTIKLESANRKKLQESMGMFNEVKKQLMADLKKHESGKSKLEEKDIEDRKMMVGVFAREIQDLTKKNSRVKNVGGQSGNEEESELAKSRREARKAKKDEEKARRKRRGKKGEPEEKEEEPQPMTAEEQAFMQQHDQNVKDQDDLLDEISKGMDELKQIGLDMNKTLTIQNQMLDVIEEKVDNNINKLKNANARLKDIMEQSGGMTVWCPRMICLILLLGLVGYMFNIV